MAHWMSMKKPETSNRRKTPVAAPAALMRASTMTRKRRNTRGMRKSTRATVVRLVRRRAEREPTKAK
jgi:hypothetical protein